MADTISQGELLNKYNRINDSLGVYQSMMEMLSINPHYGGEQLFDEFKEVIIKVSNNSIEEIQLLVPTGIKNHYNISGAHEHFIVESVEQTQSYIKSIYQEKYKGSSIHVQQVHLAPTQSITIERKLITNRDFYIVCKTAEQIKDDDLSLLTALSLCIEFTERHNCDHLTGVLNITAALSKFFHLYNCTLSGAIKEKAIFSLFTVELDDFNRFYNQLNHKTVEHILFQVAEVLKSCFSRSHGKEPEKCSMITRFDTERFLVAMPASSIKEFESKASDFLEEIKKSQFFLIQNRHNKKRIKVSINLKILYIDRRILKGKGYPSFKGFFSLVKKQWKKKQSTAENNCEIIEWPSDYQAEHEN